MIKMVLFDRDNTLICMPNKKKYLYGDDEIIFCLSVLDAIKYLNDHKIITCVVTNQRGISLDEYPNMTIESVEHFHNRLIRKLQDNNLYINEIFYCPHDEKDKCECRKPKPGMVTLALNKYSIKREESFLIGDSEIDKQTAYNAGVQFQFYDKTSDNMMHLIENLNLLT